MSTTTDSTAETPTKLARRGARVALRWALAGAVCAGAIWSGTLFVLLSGAEFSVISTTLTGHTLAVALLFGGFASVVGLAAGAFVGLLRGGQERGTVAVIFSTIGALFGIVGGGLSVPAVVALATRLHPIISSSLAWALAGLIAGFIGYDWSQWAQPAAPPADETEEEISKEREAAPPRRVEWLLRQPERRLRDWPLFRVLPVLLVSAFILVGAAVLSPSDAALAFAAAGALGLSTALVVHAQVYRLRDLEARFHELDQRLRAVEKTREENSAVSDTGVKSE